MIAHSSLGASSAKRWMTCPGSFVLHEQTAPAHPGGSIYAAAGTVAHALAETALELDAPASSIAHQTVKLGEHEISVDTEMVAAIGVYLDAVQARVVPGAEVHFETRVSLDPWFEVPPPVPMFGTADTWIWDPQRGRLMIVDFKFGSGVFVQAQDNPQLLYYAAGVLLLVPREQVREVELVVVQPRARGQDPVRGEVIDVLDLRRWIDFELAPAVAAVTQPNAPLVPGTHCRFCNAKAVCPAHVDARLAEARAQFSDVSDTPELSRMSGDLPDNYAF